MLKIFQIGAEAVAIDYTAQIYPGIVTAGRCERKVVIVQHELVSGYCQTLSILRIEPGNDYMVRTRADFQIHQRNHGMTVKKIYRPLEPGMTLVIVFFQAVAITFKADHAST